VTRIGRWARSIGDLQDICAKYKGTLCLIAEQLIDTRTAAGINNATRCVR
jgi:hypothetical protein